MSAHPAEVKAAALRQSAEIRSIVRAGGEPNIDWDHATLSALEAVIARGLASFVHVGTALSTIRDRKLYANTHASFDEYCESEWGITRRHGNHLIVAAEVVHGLPAGTIVPENEGQARALGKVPEARRAEVMNAVGSNPTAAAITAEWERIQREEAQERHSADAAERTRLLDEDEIRPSTVPDAGPIGPDAPLPIGNDEIAPESAPHPAPEPQPDVAAPVASDPPAVEGSGEAAPPRPDPKTKPERPPRPLGHIQTEARQKALEQWLIFQNADEVLTVCNADERADWVSFAKTVQTWADRVITLDKNPSLLLKAVRRSA